MNSSDTQQFPLSKGQVVRFTQRAQLLCRSLVKQHTVQEIREADHTVRLDNGHIYDSVHLEPAQPN